MTQDNFGIGVFVGGVAFLLLVTLIWHISESECQQEHNVADCVLVETLFVPAPPTDERE